MGIIMIKIIYFIFWINIYIVAVGIKSIIVEVILNFTGIVVVIDVVNVVGIIIVLNWVGKISIYLIEIII